MKALIGALAAAALITGAHGAAAQGHDGWGGRHDGERHEWRERGEHRDWGRGDRGFGFRDYQGGFRAGWDLGYAAPYGYAYPQDDGRYDAFVYAYLDGRDGRAIAPECGYWEQGREAWTYVFVQTACAPHQAAWSYR